MLEQAARAALYAEAPLGPAPTAERMGAPLSNSSVVQYEGVRREGARAVGGAAGGGPRRVQRGARNRSLTPPPERHWALDAPPPERAVPPAQQRARWSEDATPGRLRERGAGGWRGARDDDELLPGAVAARDEGGPRGGAERCALCGARHAIEWHADPRRTAAPSGVAAARRGSAAPADGRGAGLRSPAAPARLPLPNRGARRPRSHGEHTSSAARGGALGGRLRGRDASLRLPEPALPVSPETAAAAAAARFGARTGALSASPPPLPLSARRSAQLAARGSPERVGGAAAAPYGDGRAGLVPARAPAPARALGGRGGGGGGERDVAPPADRGMAAVAVGRADARGVARQSLADAAAAERRPRSAAPTALTGAAQRGYGGGDGRMQNRIGGGGGAAVPTDGRGDDARAAEQYDLFRRGVAARESGAPARADVEARQPWAEEALSAVPKQRAWACSACTFENRDFAMACAMCETPRLGAPRGRARPDAAPEPAMPWPAPAPAREARADAAVGPADGAKACCVIC